MEAQQLFNYKNTVNMSEKEYIREIILIGRGNDCNYICEDASVSRQHAQIIDYGTYCSVVDLGSTNGTYVNGRRIQNETPLHSGDELRAGNAIVPWNQLVQPPQKPKNNKKLLWILLAAITVILIGGGIAFYLLYGHTNSATEEVKQEKKEVVKDLAKTIDENKEIEAENDSLKTNNESLKQENSRLKKDNEGVEANKKEAQKEAEKARQEAEKARQEAEEAKREAERLKLVAQTAKEEAASAMEEAANQKEAASQAKEAASRAKDEAEKAKREMELVNAIENSLNYSDAERICMSLSIKYGAGQGQLPGKEALKNAYVKGDEAMKQRIAEAVEAALKKQK